MKRVSSEKYNALCRAARSVAANAYIPYSEFRVGAAVLAKGGRIYAGCNVENASYGLTNCAERSALFAAVGDGLKPLEVEALMIYTPTSDPQSPCGACRQVMSEFLGPDTPIFAICDGEGVQEWTMGELLPDSFSLSDVRGEE